MGAGSDGCTDAQDGVCRTKPVAKGRWDQPYNAPRRTTRGSGYRVLCSNDAVHRRQAKQVSAGCRCAFVFVPEVGVETMRSDEIRAQGSRVSRGMNVRLGTERERGRGCGAVRGVAIIANNLVAPKKVTSELGGDERGGLKTEQEKDRRKMMDSLKGTVGWRAACFRTKREGQRGGCGRGGKQRAVTPALSLSLALAFSLSRSRLCFPKRLRFYLSEGHTRKVMRETIRRAVPPCTLGLSQLLGLDGESAFRLISSCSAVSAAGKKRQKKRKRKIVEWMGHLQNERAQSTFIDWLTVRPRATRRGTKCVHTVF